MFPAVHHTANTSPILWIRTHHITAVYIIPQTPNNFNCHYFIISHSYPICFYITIQKQNFNRKYMFLILSCVCDTQNTLVFLYQKHHPEDGQITRRNMLVKIL